MIVPSAGAGVVIPVLNQVESTIGLEDRGDPGALLTIPKYVKRRELERKRS